jgi:hypothetical protein
MKISSVRRLAALAAIPALLTVAGPLNSAEKDKPGITVDWGKMKDAPRSDEPYSAAGLRAAFGELCKKLGYRIMRVEVDQSAHPFLLYGVLDGRCDYQEIHEALDSMPGYAYVGSVTMVQREGSRTVFALNMTPSDQYPRDRETAQRLRERMKSLVTSQL